MDNLKGISKGKFYKERIVLPLPNGIEISRWLMRGLNNVECIFETDNYKIKIHTVKELLNREENQLDLNKNYTGFSFYALKKVRGDLEIKEIGSLFQIMGKGVKGVINPFKFLYGENTEFKDTNKSGLWDIESQNINIRNYKNSPGLIKLLGRELEEKEYFKMPEYLDEKWRAGIFSVFTNGEDVRISIGNPYHDGENAKHEKVRYEPICLIDYQGKRNLESELISHFTTPDIEFAQMSAKRILTRYS